MIDVEKLTDVEIDGINTWDYPDFVDAFISSASWEDGTALTDKELDDLNDNYTDFVYDRVIESLHGE